MKYKILNYIARKHNFIPLIGLITFGLPVQFTRWVYRTNKQVRPWKKRACFTLSFDCDYPEDVSAIPALLGLLKRNDLMASFACVGRWIEEYPEEHKMIIDHGHEIVNHTYSHPDNEILNPGRKFRYISRNEKKEEIERCHDICLKILKVEPSGCRIPHFKNLFTNEIYGILKELQYSYSTSTWLTNTTTGGMPFKTKEGIIEFPLSTCPKHPFTVFDTWHTINSPRWSHRIVHRRGVEDYINEFYRLIDIGIENNAYLNLYLDPLDVPKIDNFSRLIEELKNLDIEIVTYQQYINKFQIMD